MAAQTALAVFRISARWLTIGRILNCLAAWPISWEISAANGLYRAKSPAQGSECFENHKSSKGIKNCW